MEVSDYITQIFARSYYAYPEGEDAELLKIDFKNTKHLFEVNFML
jgi:hypothetical protein